MPMGMCVYVSPRYTNQFGVTVMSQRPCKRLECGFKEFHKKCVHVCTYILKSDRYPFENSVIHGIRGKVVPACGHIRCGVTVMPNVANKNKWCDAGKLTDYQRQR